MFIHQLNKNPFLPLATCLLLLASCSLQKQISRSAQQLVIKDSSLTAAHVGISIYEPAANKYWFNYQGDKYFVPASNTKLPTCYAAMKYLGDSLVGLKYGLSEEKDSNHIVLGIQPTGDPTFLHSDYKKQPVWSFLSLNAARYKEQIGILDTLWQDEKWGSGWSWNDYDAAYMAERSVMPIYGNVIDIKLNDLVGRNVTDTINWQGIILFKTQNRIFDAMVNSNVYLLRHLVLEKQPMIKIRRGLSDNSFWVDENNRRFTSTSIPFVTSDRDNFWRYNIHLATALRIISDTLKFRFGSIIPREKNSTFTFLCPDCKVRTITIKHWYKLHSQPTDSLLKPMMHRSDNFFAEQTLLMVSNELLGVMNDEKIIDSLLKTDLKDLPQKPRWVDGSGLSRYNLFTPQSFVTILNKMKNDFPMERIKEILPTGGEGTLSSYYKSDSGYIYAKTGTLSGVVALSGYLYTKKNKLLIFSVLVNNHQSSATAVRRAVEKFIQKLRNQY